MLCVRHRCTGGPATRSGRHTTAYLEAIFKTLQNPGSPGNGTVLPAWTGPRSMGVTVSVLLYASLSTSLLAAFLAMLGKQ